MTSAADRQLMRRALRLAERGWGCVAPNPLVGALVVRDGRVIAEGWHERYGESHAEVNALRAAGETARGATLFVTLEPCAHHGKTPPCTQAIVDAGIAEVVFAAPDPNPRAGGGAAFLAARGVLVRGGVEAQAARRLDPAFFHRHEQATAFVALKLALSLDAKLSRTAGLRTQLTGTAAQRAVHRLRAGFDAIMVGSGTACADDPLLTVRGDVQPRIAPRRIVIDSAASLSPASRLASTTAESPVWLFCDTRVDAARRTALEARGVRTFALPAGRAGLPLEDVLATLWHEGVAAVLCEGGARLAAGLLGDRHVHRQYLFYAPRLLGPSAVTAFPAEDAGTGDAWQLVRVRRFADDVMLVLDPQEASH